MHDRENRDRLRHLRAIPLESVLVLSGARRDPHDKAKWHTAKGALSITGMKFMNWNRGHGGGGAIDLAMHLNGLDFKAAVDWLGRCFSIADYVPPPRTHRSLILPSPDRSKLHNLRHYLVQTRGLTAALIDALVDAGKLYADSRGNVVFLLLGKENKPVGAELRGTGSSRWRGMAPGSCKDLGYFCIAVPQPTMIVLCESAIDAISCFLLHPTSMCVSTSGARPNPQWLPSLLCDAPVYCGFDADPTGDAMADQMIALYPKLRRLRPAQHDWNDLLKSLRSC